jgi:GTP pyrophosphokinase
MDYGITDPVVLKAAVIHDLFEDAMEPRDSNLEEEVRRIDEDGPAVCALVQELTIRIENDIKEPKPQYLSRIMTSGSRRARILKLADRISNVTFLGFVHDRDFIEKYIAETREEILPYAESISKDMFRELSDLVDNREIKLGLMDREAEDTPNSPDRIRAGR